MTTLEVLWTRMHSVITETTCLYNEIAHIIIEYCKALELDQQAAEQQRRRPRMKRMARIADVSGYAFYAPCDFTICQLRVQDDQRACGPQSVQVIKFNPCQYEQRDATIPMYCNNWKTLFLCSDSGDDYVLCHIPVKQGDAIGIIGHRSNYSIPSGTANEVQPYIYEHKVQVCRVSTWPNHSAIPLTSDKCHIGRLVGGIGKIAMWYY
eukprot:CAMPEP_0197040384 /NCGR_PEP_ID=MMETSP1384-20130603/17094_1 /TAXON_ID=29189 /ORGANISM="Ammonia sp." /LENGTH=207 /DNA_ID=CAMNT_0042471127 /DNA_START=42 /DNA_END=665 /DNA_ORIENTATION=-